MHFAAECGHLDIVKGLLKHGAKMTRNLHGIYMTRVFQTKLSRITVVYFANLLDFHRFDAIIGGRRENKIERSRISNQTRCGFAKRQN
jgi:hypothetical protein